MCFGGDFLVALLQFSSGFLANAPSGCPHTPTKAKADIGLPRKKSLTQNHTRKTMQQSHFNYTIFKSNCKGKLWMGCG